MVPFSATRDIIRLSEQAATSAVEGGLERKVNDLKSYATTGVSSGLSFAIAHIPIVGPSLSKAFDVGSSMGIAKAYEKWFKQATTPEERIGYGLTLLEKSMAADIRQTYNTLSDWAKKEQKAVSTHAKCDDCQEAFQVAYSTALAADCLEDLEAAAAMFAKMAEDLNTVVARQRMVVEPRVRHLESRIEDFRHNHPHRACVGTRKCYWLPVRSPFSSITNEDL